MNSVSNKLIRGAAEGRGGVNEIPLLLLTPGEKCRRIINKSSLRRRHRCGQSVLPATERLLRSRGLLMKCRFLMIPICFGVRGG